MRQLKLAIAIDLRLNQIPEDRNQLQCDLDERLPSKMGSHSYCYGDSKDDRNLALEVVDTRIEFTLHGYLKSIAQ